MFRTYLMTLTISVLTVAVLSNTSYGLDDGPARKLINSQGCKACHALEGDGGSLAVSFEEMRENLTRTEIRSQLVNQEQRHGNGAIPDFGHLSDNDLETLIEFILTVPDHTGHR